MSFFDRLFGGGERERAGPRTDDQHALERYRYLLRTAPPEAIEQVHAEAFAQLTPEQRQQLLQELAAEVPEYERGRATDDPRNLARLATRAEVRQPGTLERTFTRMPVYGESGPSFGSMFASSLLGSVAGYVIGSAIADQFFQDAPMSPGGDFAMSDSQWAETGDLDPAGFDAGGDFDVSDI